VCTTPTVGTHTRNTLQSFAVRMDSSGHTCGDTTCESQMLQVRAVPDEIVAHGCDTKFTNTREYSVFVLECLRNGSSGADTQDFQCLQVGQPSQAVDKFCHQIFRGVQEGELNRKGPTETLLVSYVHLQKKELQVPDVGSNGLVRSQIDALSVQTRIRTSSSSPVVVPNVRDASLSIGPKESKE